jgi:hypothetical protein
MSGPTTGVQTMIGPLRSEIELRPSIRIIGLEAKVGSDPTPRLSRFQSWLCPIDGRW